MAGEAIAMILVDELQDYPHGPHGIRLWCHMGTDDQTDAGLEELHAMAARIGMRREWFQNKPNYPHYDLTEGLRAAAVAAGAQEVHPFEFVRRIRRAV